MVHPWPALLISASGALAAGCGSVGSAGGATGHPAIASREPNSPLRAALAWFGAIDAKEQHQVLAAFAPGVAAGTSWREWGAGSWPTFSGVRCKGESQTAISATVMCTFSESQAPSTGNPVSFWTVSFVHTLHGRWLIVNYGQG